MKKKSLLLLTVAAITILVPLLFSTGCSPLMATPPAESDVSITIDGLVDNPLTINRDALLAYPSITEEILLVCPGFFQQLNKWTGVSLAKIFSQAYIQPEAKEAVFYGSDGYNYTLSLEKDDNGILTVLPVADKTSTVILAYETDGKMITGLNPIRLVVPGAVGAQWVNHIVRIEVK
jgi:DMSO/TMAO reductase YedYZ molybdopterin-dependent catalytic subunit